jgi:hypothetical protein
MIQLERPRGAETREQYKGTKTDAAKKTDEE